MRRIPVLFLALGILAVAAFTLRATAQEGLGGPTTQGAGPAGPKAGGPPGGPGGGFHLLPRFVADKLKLTPDQVTQIAALEKDTKAKLDAILTPEQQKILEQAHPPRPAGPGAQGGQSGPNAQGGQGGQGGGHRGRGGPGGGSQGGPGGGPGGQGGNDGGDAPPPPPQD